MDFLHQIPHTIFDYQYLMNVLRHYASPRDKITHFLRNKDILRVKKGLYVLGDALRQKPLLREELANLMYGPSYVSLEYALSYYGMIPEQATTVTSVTIGRSRIFQTPVGRFSYRQISLPAFRVGMERVEQEDGQAFLIASREKALADKLAAEKNLDIQSQGGLQTYLERNLRMSIRELATLEFTKMQEIATQYHSKKIRLLAGVIRHLRKQGL
jgi:predicted transcriptional regulator of viral defense system